MTKPAFRTLCPTTDDDLTEPEITPNEPNPSRWPPFDHWRRVSPRQDGVLRFWNSRYSVSIKTEKQSLVPGALCWRVLIIRSDQSAHHDWRDYQRIKNELFGERFEALELYPAERRLVDPSNAFVLFVFDRPIRIGDQRREVRGQATSIAPQRGFHF